ncbi:Trypsin-like peptidase domain-containing protein [Gracilibacillus orientalis]|uniref:Trypsin-like peptidase domain-containing protein n=1 Tax=Gracilibacillus orientalis TaxID=334253 RepID=A0A1I4HJW7_9BACI|nr:serine protease [Gracilibacillus orientalis]SFL41686.1 Trypsin-like peptidase domain-containing protein [Gracilibacillus orientalis]
MKHSDDKKRDIIDEDLYEEIDPEEMYELVQEERRKLEENERTEAEDSKKRVFPKWAVWSIAIAMFIQVIAILPQTFSIPAIEFIQTSGRLMQDETVQQYRDAVVVIEGEDNKGTGFAISTDGYIITNYHVIEDQPRITVAFQEEGLYNGEVVETYPEIDLAVLDIEAENLPYLALSDKNSEEQLEDVLFIGNPLRFNGIANEGDLIGKTQLSSWEKPVYMLDAPVYRGNSGSPVLNEQGDVIAVVFATQKNEEHGRVGLAVPIEYLNINKQ